MGLLMSINIIMSGYGIVFQSDWDSAMGTTLDRLTPPPSPARPQRPPPTMSDSDAEEDWDSEDEGPAAADRKKISSATTAAGAGSRRGRSVGADMMVRERGEDGTSVVDLLDSSMVRNMRVSKSGGRRKGVDGSGVFGSDDSDSDDSDGDDGPELGLRDGKFVIPGGSDDDSDDDSEDDARGGGRRKKRQRGGTGGDSDDDNYVVDTGKNEAGFAHIPGRRARAAEGESNVALPAGAQGRIVPGGRGAGNPNQGAAGKRQKVAAVRGTATGAEFRSKKAGGDVKRKGATLEPYAYIPLDGRTLTGKKAGKTAVKQYGAVVGTVRGAKRGYQKRGGQKK